MILPSHRKMLQIIFSNPGLRRSELADLYGASNGSHTIAANLNFLKKNGLVICEIRNQKRYTVTVAGTIALRYLDGIDVIVKKAAAGVKE